jgi:hypothetical protein
MATDVGILFHDRRELQTAADGAAVAGALEQQYGGSTAQIVAAADTAASSNGFTDGSNGVTVTVINPPTSGYHQSSGYVEVNITQASVPTVLMGLFGSKNVNVATRAVAGSVAASINNVWLSDSLTLRGSATIDASGIYVDSNSPNAVDTTGNGNTINAAYIATPGGLSGSGQPQGTTVVTGAAPEPNPLLAQVSSGNPNSAGAPDATTACTNTNTNLATSFSGSIDGGAGTSTNIYCFSGANVDISGATLSDGTFIFENGVTIGSGTTLTTIKNAVLDLAGGAYNQILTSNEPFYFKAPQVDPSLDQWNNGIALFVPTTNLTYKDVACNPNPNDTKELMVQFGASNQTFDGYIYAPNATLDLHDQGGGTTASGVVAASLCDLSGTLRIPNYNTLFPLLRVVALVE